MGLQPGVHAVEVTAFGAVRDEAARCGAAVYVLGASLAATRDGFFAAVRAVIPMDPPLASAYSWDALSDSMFGGLYLLPEDEIVILWPESSAFSAAEPREYEIAVAVLADVAQTLSDHDLTVGNPKRLCVYIAP